MQKHLNIEGKCLKIEKECQEPHSHLSNLELAVFGVKIVS